jgi:predicted dinucleotide-binding enzyme
MSRDARPCPPALPRDAARRMNVAILGAGRVGGTLGRRLADAGHDVAFGVRTPDDPKHAAVSTGRTRITSIAEAVQASEVVILATPWAAVPDALAAAGDFGGRILVDATNPIAPGFVLAHGHTDSGAEQVARWAPTARVVKAFHSTGVENMADPVYGGIRSVMPVAGDDARARTAVLALAGDLGFDAIDAGPLVRARLLEPLAMLWITLSGPLGLGRDIAFALLHR